MLSGISILGICFLVTRVVLGEFILREELGSKRTHASRFISYYLCCAMILEFQQDVFTLISVISVPIMLMAFLFFDIPFYFKDCSKLMPKKGWQILERLTLHPPSILFGIYFYFSHRMYWIFYFQLFTISNFLCGCLLGLVPLFLFDPRILVKEEYPRGVIILIGTIVNIIGNIIFFILNANTRGFFEWARYNNYNWW